MTQAINPGQPARWVIDLGWYQQNNRSFIELAQRGLCPKCVEKFSRRKKKAGADDILSNITSCCSQDPRYITSQLPIIESVFRLLLANSNEPLPITVIAAKLSERRGGDPLPVEKLTRILNSDRWYGLFEVDEDPKKS